MLHHIISNQSTQLYSLDTKNLLVGNSGATLVLYKLWESTCCFEWTVWYLVLAFNGGRFASMVALLSHEQISRYASGGVLYVAWQTLRAQL